MLSLPLLLALSFAHADPVVVPVDSVIFPDTEEPEAPPTAFITSRSILYVEPGDEHVELELLVEIDPMEPGWVELRLLDGSVRLYDDSDEDLRLGSDGHWWFTGELDRPRTVYLRGSVPRRGDSVRLQVAPGVRQEVRGVGRGLDFDVFGAVGGHLPPTELVEVSWKKHVDTPPVLTRVVQGRVSTAAWIDEGDLRVRSAIRWTVRRGEADRFEIVLPGRLDELEVTGAGVARFDRSGDRIVVTPTEAVDGVFEVLVDWRLPFKDKNAQITQPKLPGTTTATTTLTLAGDAELLLSPETKGLRGAALAELPAQARSVGDATPTAAWTGGGTLTLKALQLTSLDGPDLVVDRAVCTEASSVGGRSLLRCQLDVRNASRQFLRVAAPEGSALWSARVNGEGVAPVVVEDGTMAVPLERSVETLSGLTTLDVELTFVGQAQPWRERRKGWREVALPSFDAPVAHLEWEFRLPPGYTGELEGGTSRAAGETSAEIVYALTTVEEQQAKQAARETWNAALRAYQDNDFDTAQSYVDQTLQLDGANENAARLQSNLDVLSGKDGDAGGGDEAMSRRVKDMAKAKVADAEFEQADKLEEADRALASGDYEKAMEVYEEVEELSKELSRYEQKEQNEQAWYGSSSSSGYAEAKKRKAERDTSLAYGRNDVAEDGVLGALGTAGIEGDLVEATGGLIGTKSEGIGSAGLGSRGSGYGGGGSSSYMPDAAAAPADPEPVSGAYEVTLNGAGEYLMGELDDYYDYDIDETEPYVEVPPEAFESGEVRYDYQAPGVTAVMEEPQEAFDDVEYDFATGTAIVDLVPDNARRVRLQKEPASEPAPEPAPVVTREFAARAPVTDAQPRSAPVTTKRSVEIVSMPALSATTLAIPLPDHGQSLTVVQRLLAPGEVPTLELTYRENR